MLPKPLFAGASSRHSPSPLIILNTGWIANSEMRAGMTEMTISTLFLGVTFILFVVTLLNLLVRQAGRAAGGLIQPELMALYSLLSISSAVAGVGNIGFFTPFLAKPFYFANHGNRWNGFWHLLPACRRPARPGSSQGRFTRGIPTFFRLRSWRPGCRICWSGASFFLSSSG